MGKRVAIVLGLAAAAVVGLMAALLLERRAGTELPPLLPGVELSSIEGVSIQRDLDFGGSSSRRGPDGIETEGKDVRSLVEIAYGVPKGGVILDARLPDGLYKVTARAQGPATPHERLQAGLRQVFGITGRRETRPVQVLALAQAEESRLMFTPKPGTWRETKSSHHNGRRHFKFRGDMKQLADELQGIFKVPVLDETGLQGDYEGELFWSDSEGKTLLDALKAAGFDLKEARRPVEVLVIEKAR